MKTRLKLLVLVCAAGCAALGLADSFTWIQAVSRAWDEPDNWISSGHPDWPHESTDVVSFEARQQSDPAWTVGLVDATILNGGIYWSVSFNRKSEGTPVLTFTDQLNLDNTGGSADLDLTISNARIVVEGGG